MNMPARFHRTAAAFVFAALSSAPWYSCFEAPAEDDGVQETKIAAPARTAVDEPVQAFTVLGDGVVLNPDGTWETSGRRGVFEVDTNGIGSWQKVPVSKLLRAEVAEVYDGDTLTVTVPDPPPGIGKTERVRLLGIDTPELDGSSPEGKTSFARAARDFTAGLALSKPVFLAFESAWRDGFSRLLCYAYLEDGSLLNARILSSGLAAVFTDIRCVFQDEFLDLEAAARKAGFGIWGGDDSDGVVIATVRNDGTSEFVELINRSSLTKDISGWTITDEGGTVLRLPEATVLPPGGVFRVYSGTGAREDGGVSIHPTTRQIWNNGGDTAKLFSKTGEPVDEYSY